MLGIVELESGHHFAGVSDNRSGVTPTAAVVFDLTPVDGNTDRADTYR
jgi:hypothetical protein